MRAEGDSGEGCRREVWREASVGGEENERVLDEEWSPEDDVYSDEDAPSDENASREKRNDWYSKRASMTHLNTLGERTGVRSTRESWYIAKMLFSYSFCFRYSFASFKKSWTKSGSVAFVSFTTCDCLGMRTR